MATVKWQATAPNWGDSTWRTYITDLHTRITAIGLTQTSDTGQMPYATYTPTTLVQANTGSVLQGYLMYAFNDSLQSTLPVYIKFTFYKYRAVGQTTSLLYPTHFYFSCQVGTATDGAGNFTVGEVASSAYMHINQASNTTIPNPNPATFPEVYTPYQQNQGYDSVMCWDSAKGYFYLQSMPGFNNVNTVPTVTSTVASNGCAGMVHIQRSVNTSNVPTGEYIVSTATGGSLQGTADSLINVTLTQTTLTAYSVVTQNTTLPVIPISSYIVNGQVQLQRTYLLAPNTRLDTSPWLFSIPLSLAQQNQQMTITLPDASTLPVIVMSGMSVTSLTNTVSGFASPASTSYGLVTYFG